jgi:hypothetical protein
MFEGEGFVRDEGFPHNTTPRVRDLLTLTMFGGERFVRDEGFPHNTTPRVRDLLTLTMFEGERFVRDEGFTEIQGWGVRGFPMMG